MTARIIGAILFLLAAAAAVGYGYYSAGAGGGLPDPVSRVLLGERAEQIEVMGLIGGEKMGFLASQKVKDRLEDLGVARLDARRAGSLDMVQDPQLLAQNPDFLWPSSQVALEIARSRNLPLKGDQIIFNSPIVFYSWLPIAEALEAQGLARPLTPEKVSYGIDTKAFLELLLTGKRWSEIGVTQLFNGMKIITTDPRRSNSGNQAASLMLQILSDQQATGAPLAEAMDKVVRLYSSMGFLQSSSGTLFEQYLATGMGQYPVIAGYENQLIEFVREKPDLWTRVMQQPIRPVLLYPEPTVYSSHIALALTDKGRRMNEILLDPELQALAWTDHGFRTGLASTSDPGQLPLPGLPSQVTSIINMPPFRATEQLLQRLTDQGL